MEAESADNVFIPQVTFSRIPKIGQEFESHEEAYNFYNEYAREAGFSARIANSKKNKETGEIYWKLFVCSKEGKTDETYQNTQKFAVVRMTTLKCSMTEEMMELSLPKLEMMELLILKPEMMELSLPKPVVIMMS
ncbi:Protein FAR1-RELATED SEQUENCE 6 [Abeliophyllum distichum]|uniref:Protein FAR1-RELATED SEQUENCE 6 n=1 Tax=Abeliophyllum distichum TaxID=126358 RepID=A0ABD1PE61_9LAMI